MEVRIRSSIAKKYLLLLWLFSGLFLGGGWVWTAAQDDSSRILVNVVLVQLNVAVTDHKGNYISGLRPEDFAITEDKIPQTLSTFEEGNGPTLRPETHGAGSIAQAALPSSSAATAETQLSQFAGANVFILFDTSNYMYRGFVFAQDAIADFIRSLEGVSKVAFYSYSRDLSRSAPLTADREAVLRGVRSSVAGDDAALYNCLLLTVKDTARLQGRKVIVVFSNGPDNASSVPPEDVAELAQSTGTIIYMISTSVAQNEPVSTAVFERMSKATGGKAYFAKSWRDEKQAFASIRDDLAHLYSLSYYPQPNPNRGWRTISIKLVGKDLQKYHVRTRDGYRLLQQAQISSGSYNTPEGGAGGTAQK
ncbi:VWA domain-containing protein [Alloacidobacterium sp.]|uniref:VWA domain-containing protein n=1 Tax=Alloacidobacterium sp. TaxID=2951999 RepID=UPI002D2E66B8|nr:VWA domain-containing protein [Alloacidobacterium sp.]HYK36125.1 VWA domain-containing protein [Alloacidobacterium sp.]